ncbi:MAG TPA: hypothetical protein VK737_09740 [Opitutales bacterium]|jgi:hypothetical protein|nr:hypothetical protein [Opitutales bacterium]
MVIDLVSKLPENTPLPDIMREIEFLAGLQEGLEQAERGEGVSVDEARKLLRQWVSKSS